MAVIRIVPDLPAAEPRAPVPSTSRCSASRSGWTSAGSLPSSPPVRRAYTLLREDASAPVAPDVSIEVDDVDAAAVARGDEIVHPLTDESWGVRRFFVREPGGRVVNVLAHR